MKKNNLYSKHYDIVQAGAGKLVIGLLSFLILVGALGSQSVVLAEEQNGSTQHDIEEELDKTDNAQEGISEEIPVKEELLEGSTEDESVEESENEQKNNDGSWQNVDLQVNTVYKAPNNEGVNIVFKSLPEGEKYLNINERQVNLNGEAYIGYDFTSNMSNSTFTYIMTLPNEYGENVEVIYSEDTVNFNKVLESEVQAYENKVEVSSNHFTTFVVTPVVSAQDTLRVSIGTGNDGSSGTIETGNGIPADPANEPQVNIPANSSPLHGNVVSGSDVPVYITAESDVSFTRYHIRLITDNENENVDMKNPSIDGYGDGITNYYYSTVVYQEMINQMHDFDTTTPGVQGLDTTLLPDGTYWLVLGARDVNGRNVDSRNQDPRVRIVVDNPEPTVEIDEGGEVIDGYRCGIGSDLPSEIIDITDGLLVNINDWPGSGYTLQGRYSNNGGTTYNNWFALDEGTFGNGTGTFSGDTSIYQEYLEYFVEHTGSPNNPPLSRENIWEVRIVRDNDLEVVSNVDSYGYISVFPGHDLYPYVCGQQEIVVEEINFNYIENPESVDTCEMVYTNEVNDEGIVEQNINWNQVEGAGYYEIDTYMLNLDTLVWEYDSTLSTNNLPGDFSISDNGSGIVTLNGSVSDEGIYNYQIRGYLETEVGEDILIGQSNDVMDLDFSGVTTCPFIFDITPPQTPQLQCPVDTESSTVTISWDSELDALDQAINQILQLEDEAGYQIPFYGYFITDGTHWYNTDFVMIDEVTIDLTNGYGEYVFEIIAYDLAFNSTGEVATCTINYIEPNQEVEPVQEPTENVVQPSQSISDNDEVEKSVVTVLPDTGSNQVNNIFLAILSIFSAIVMLCVLGVRYKKG